MVFKSVKYSRRRRFFLNGPSFTTSTVVLLAAHSLLKTILIFTSWEGYPGLHCRYGTFFLRHRSFKLDRLFFYICLVSLPMDPFNRASMAAHSSYAGRPYSSISSTRRSTQVHQETWTMETSVLLSKNISPLVCGSTFTSSSRVFNGISTRASTVQSRTCSPHNHRFTTFDTTASIYYVRQSGMSG